MAAKQVTRVCPQCGESIIGKLTRNFAGHETISCPTCYYKGVIPLAVSTQIFLWTVTITVLVVAYSLATTGQGRIGWLGFIAPIMLFGDWRARRNINNHRKQTGVEGEYQDPPERYGVFKGIVYSILILLLFAAASYSLYYSNTNPTGVTTTAATSNTASWQKFNSAEGKFTATFPSYPKQTSSNESANGVNFTLVQYDSTSQNGEEYLVQYINYPLPANQLDPKSVEQGSLNGEINGDSSYRLINSSFVQVGQHQAIDYLIYSGKDSAYLKGRNILVGSTLYSLLSSSKSQEPAEYQRFIDSFSLTGSEQL